MKRFASSEDLENLHKMHVSQCEDIVCSTFTWFATHIAQ